MEPSPELRAVVGRLFAAINARDLPTILNLHSEGPGLVVIGTDPDEWFSHAEVLRQVFETSLREFDEGGVSFDVGDIEAYSEGSMGWAVCRPRFLLADGSTVDLRFTAVLHLDRGVWKFVHSHLSVGVENEETVGFEMTTTFEELAAAVQDERPDLTASAAPDGTVTIMFSDIESSTELAVRLGDHEWVALLGWHDQVVTDVTSRMDGQVVKSLGDGHMLAFASAASALRAAAEIQRTFQQPHDGEWLHLRVGVHTGEVLRQSDDYFGRAVITAARVAAAAQGDEVLASSIVVELTENVEAFTFGEPRSEVLKGLPGLHALFPLMWDRVAVG